MNESLKFIGATAAGIAVGLVVGYKVAEKRLSVQFEERLERETAEMKVFYKAVKKPYATPEEAVADLMPEPDPEPEEAKIVDPRVKAQKVQYNKIVKVEEYEAPADDEEGAKAAEDLVRNIFTPDEPDPEKPYLIKQDAFMQNERDYDQATLTFYEQGGVLTDERDTPFEDIASVAGSDFPAWFGAGSSDVNVVHVRNESLRMEFEICRSTNSYEVDVLGQEG